MTTTDPITHAKVSAKEDEGDATLVRPSDWNAVHVGGTRIVWKDAEVNVMTDLNRTGVLNWTDLDLTASTSATAKFAILQLLTQLDSWTSGIVQLAVRKNGTTPNSFPAVFARLGGPSLSYDVAEVMVALDANRICEYRIFIGGTAQVDTYINVLGYIE